MTTPARKYHTEQTHFLRAVINFNDAAATTGELVGVVPAGSLIASVDLYITTAFNAGTTNTLSAGKTLTGTDYVSATAAGTAAVTKTAAPVAASLLAADQAIYVSYGTSGTAATAGQAYVVVTYFPNI